MGFFKSLFGSDPNGKVFKLDANHNVYYKGEGVTELDAAHTAGFFKGLGYFKDDNSIDLQIISPTGKPDELKVNFIVNPKYVTPESGENFKAMVTAMYDLFPQKKLSAALVDPNFKVVSDLGYMQTPATSG